MVNKRSLKMITKAFEKINLKDIDEINASLGNLIKMSQEAVNQKKGFAITGKISLTDKYTLETLATYDVVFPIYVAGFKRMGKEKFGKEVNINLLSTSFDLDGLDKLSLNEVNRIAMNVNILNLRVGARLTEYAFKDLITTPVFYTKWHFIDKSKDHMQVTKLIRALRNPELNENPNTKEQSLFINTLASSKNRVRTYVGINVYKLGDKLRENYEDSDDDND